MIGIRLDAKLSGQESEAKMKIFTISYGQQDDWWVAQVKEYDIAMQAKTLPDLFIEIGRVLAGYHVIAEELGQEPFANIPPAP